MHRNSYAILHLRIHSRLSFMNIRTIFFVILGCFFLTCKHSSSTSDAAIATIEKMIQRGGFHDTTYEAVNRFVAKTGLNDVHLRLLYYKYASEYYRLSHNYKKAMWYADTMLSIVNERQYRDELTKERALANLAKANVLYEYEEYKDCYYYYGLGSIEASKINDSAVTEEVNNCLSMFLYNEGNYRKAVYYYRQLLKNTNGIHKTFERLASNNGVLDNMGLSYLKASEPDSAIFCFSEAIRNIKEAALIAPERAEFCLLAQGIVFGNLAQSYQMKGDYAMAESLYQKSIAINSKPNNEITNALITQRQLAELYEKQKNLPRLNETLHEIKKGLDTIPDKKVEMQWNFLMSRYASAMNDPSAAMIYMNRYLEYKDSLNKVQKVPAESNILDQLKIMQSRYDMMMLEKHDKEKSMFLWLAVILLVSLFTISVQFFSNLKKSKKHMNDLVLLNKEIKSKQEQLEQSLEELKRRNLEKRRIIHVVAHDLRSPLSAIKALATLIEEDYQNEEINRQSLTLIKSVCTDSGELIKSLIEMVETRSVTFKPESVEVNLLLSKAVAVLQIKATEKHQKIHLLPCAEGTMVKADASKLTQVFNNIISNAIKFSSSGSDIEVSCYASDNDVTIKIKDSGIGIPQKFHARLFDTFTDAKRPGTNGEKPFGLGLSICKQIVEKHHGKIWFESVENKGTVFFIQLAKEKSSLSQIPSQQ